MSFRDTLLRHLSETSEVVGEHAFPRDIDGTVRAKALCGYEVTVFPKVRTYDPNGELLPTSRHCPACRDCALVLEMLKGGRL